MPIVETPTDQPGHAVTFNVVKQDDIWKVIQNAMNGQKAAA